MSIPKLELEKKKTLKFISYNVWFEDHNFFERAETLNEIFEKSDADFICLQEVTAKFFEILLKKQYIKENYYVSQVKK